MSDDPLVRRAGSDEHEEIASVWLAARRAAFPAMPPATHSDDDVRRWFAEEILPAHGVWVTEVDGCIVGVLVLDARWVAQLYVAPEHQGRGLGSMLIELAKVQSPDALELWTFETNIASHHFYEKHGFRLVEVTDGRDNEEGEPDRRYRWIQGG